MDEVVIEGATVTGGTAPYVDAVRGRVRRLPRARRAELFDALSHHLEELAAEPGADLHEQLGDPQDFADEFLSTAGVELPPRRSGVPIVGAVRDRFTVVVDHRWSAAVLDFLPELRPAWWVVRGYLPAAAVLSAAGATPYPFPDLDGQGLGWRLAGTAAALVAAAISVTLGRQHMLGRTAALHRWGSVVGAITVLLATHSLMSVDDRGVDAGAVVVDQAAPDVAAPRPGTSGLVYSAEGTQITNFWIYDARGNLLREVYVFDQDGQPVSTPAVNDERRETRIPVTADGQPVVNQYPQDEQVIMCSTEDGPARVYIPVEEPSVSIRSRERRVTPPPSSAPEVSPPTTVVRPEAGYPC